MHRDCNLWHEPVRRSRSFRSSHHIGSRDCHQCDVYVLQFLHLRDGISIATMIYPCTIDGKHIPNPVILPGMELLVGIIRRNGLNTDAFDSLMVEWFYQDNLPKVHAGELALAVWRTDNDCFRLDDLSDVFDAAVVKMLMRDEDDICVMQRIRSLERIKIDDLAIRFDPKTRMIDMFDVEIEEDWHGTHQELRA